MAWPESLVHRPQPTSLRRSMNPVLDLLLAGAYGTMTPEIEQLFFVVGPKALPSQTRRFRVRQTVDQNAPRLQPLPGSSESAAWDRATQRDTSKGDSARKPENHRGRFCAGPGNIEFLPGPIL